jgi:ribonucleoside-diphosphate reductase alpha chain
VKYLRLLGGICKPRLYTSSPIEIVMPLSENSRKILEARYLQKDENGNILETPDQLFARVANDIAEAEKAYGTSLEEIAKLEKQFFHMMAESLFLPNSPCLMNAGTGNQLGYAACYVLPIEDDMTSIFKALQQAALIWQAGGGTGFSFSRLRPSGALVKTSTGVSSGPVSFMKIYDGAAEQVKQGGKRRTANMAILRVDHPDIEEFITCKDTENKVLSNFNVSVAITDVFMEQLKKGANYEIINPRTKKRVDTKSASEVFRLIVQRAWKTGDPGLWFIDRANKASPIQDGTAIEATNPCGEQALQPFDVCNLGSINLGKFVIPEGVVPKTSRQFPPDEHMSGGVQAAHPQEPVTEWEEWETRIDLQHLGKIVDLSVRFLDNVIDQSTYPLKKIENMAKKNRRIGLGVMGWADMLALLKIPYDSEEALSLARFIMAFIQERAEDASIELAEDRGPFPNWKNSVFKTLTNPPRNVALTTVAPTGTISRIAGCSSGIEPYFALCYQSNVLDGQVLADKIDTLERVWPDMGARVGVIPSDIWKNIASFGGSIQDMVDTVPEDIRNIFKTALEISPEAHVRMQAAFQTYINNSVSKTINLPNTATEEDVENAYLLAWELGCRGITVYRDGSKSVQVLETKSTKAEPSLGGVDLVKPADMLPAVRIRIPTGHGTLFSTISYDEKSGKPLELFAWQGKAGGCTLAYMEALGRLISVSLRSGVSVEVVLEALRGIRCGHAGPHGGVVTLSLPDAIGLALERFLEKQGVDIQSPVVMVGNCPECGETLIFQEGCEKCMVCAYTRCG